MTSDVISALAFWGLQTADFTLVAGRENRVYRVNGPAGDLALRIKRPGYRQEDELRSELDWLAGMSRAGLQVPQPVASLSGRLLERVGGAFVDIAEWLSGSPLGQSGKALNLSDPAGTFRAIGRETARLHLASDAWKRPPGFRRCAWDINGLLGDAPLWGRFWENPALDGDTRDLLLRFRQMAREKLSGAHSGLDYGLIHADLNRENILLDGPVVRLIDFDDGGFGYRVFDLATTLLKNRAEPDYPALKSALIAGYHADRALDLSLLDLFIAIRALTYVGWIVPRIAEYGGAERNAGFVAEARVLCAACLS